MGQRLVAIDVSPGAVRVVALEATFRKAQVTMVTTVAVPPDTDGASLWQLVRDYVPKEVDNVVVSSDGRVASTRSLSFPFVDPRKVDAAVAFELESVVPYELEKTAVTWHIGHAADGRTDAVAALAAKDTVRDQISAMAAVGLEPRAVVLPAAALAELAPASDDFTAVVCVDGAVTHFALIRRGLQFARTLRVGLSGHSEAQLAVLARELTTTLRALPPSMQPTRILLTGGGSRFAGVAQELAMRLSLPVELLDVVASVAPVDVGANAIGPEYAIAVGLAVSMLRRGRSIPLNFRRGDLSYHGDLQVYRGEFTRMAVGLGAVLLCAILGSIVRYTMISAEERKINQGFCDASRKIIGREVCDPNAVMAIMKQTPGAADGVVVPAYSASSLLAMMSQSLEGIDVQFADLEMRVDGRADQNDRVTGKGDAGSFEVVEEVASKLRLDRCVKDVDVSRQKKIDAGRVEFALTVQVQCPIGVLPGQTGGAPTAQAEP